MQASGFASAREVTANAPDERTHTEASHRLPVALVQCSIGVFFTLLFAYLYYALGSAWSALSLLPVSAFLALTPSLLRRGVSLSWVAHVSFTLAWLAFSVVAYRTGGFASPALVWSFLLPLTCYTGCGRASAAVWAALAALQLAAFFVLELAGHRAPQDLSEHALSALRIVGYLGVVFTIIAVIWVVESARLVAQQALSRAERAMERQRILADMHDGAGSQLLWLAVAARRGTLEQASLVAGLESCLADLRMVLSATDNDAAWSQLLGQLRAHLSASCQSSGIALEWSADSELDRVLDSRQALHLSRILQEAATNALRHACSGRLQVRVWRDADQVCLAVRDFGVGFDPAVPRSGRGLRSMHSRARKLAGELRVTAEEPGTSVSLRFALD